MVAKILAFEVFHQWQKRWLLVRGEAGSLIDDYMSYVPLLNQCPHRFSFDPTRMRCIKDAFSISRPSCFRGLFNHDTFKCEILHSYRPSACPFYPLENRRGFAPHSSSSKNPRDPLEDPYSPCRAGHFAFCPTPKSFYDATYGICLTKEERDPEYLCANGQLQDCHILNDNEAFDPFEQSGPIGTHPRPQTYTIPLSPYEELIRAFGDSGIPKSILDPSPIPPRSASSETPSLSTTKLPRPPIAIPSSSAQIEDKNRMGSQGNDHLSESLVLSPPNRIQEPGSAMTTTPPTALPPPVPTQLPCCRSIVEILPLKRCPHGYQRSGDFCVDFRPMIRTLNDPQHDKL